MSQLDEIRPDNVYMESESGFSTELIGGNRAGAPEIVIDPPSSQAEFEQVYYGK